MISSVIPELSYRVALAQHRRKLPVLSAGDRLIVDTLKQEGVYITSLAELSLASTPNLLATANSYMSSLLTPWDIQPGYQLPQIYTVTDLPEFFNWGIEERLQKIIENYIGLPIAFHGVHFRKDFPNQQQSGTLLWHKDAEDRRMIKVIIYLHDVSEEHGPFEYIPSPHSFLGKLRDYWVDSELRKSNYLGIKDEKLSKIIPQSTWRSCPGKACTVIFADTRRILHHGTIRTQARSTLFFTYTANPPKRPELCTQYHDDTFTKPNLLVNT
jgi:hypothetical protein